MSCPYLNTPKASAPRIYADGTDVSRFRFLSRNRWKSAAVLLPFLLTVFCSAAYTQSRIDCNSLNSHILRDTVHYCVLLPGGYDAAVAGHASQHYPVLYYLHGLGENEQTLFKSGGWNLVEDLRQQHKIGDFIIVTPEAKASFYINSANGKVLYSDFFLREFIPYIEGKYRIRRERSARAISGLSMGGYGALRLPLPTLSYFRRSVRKVRH